MSAAYVNLNVKVEGLHVLRCELCREPVVWAKRPGVGFDNDTEWRYRCGCRRLVVIGNEPVPVPWAWAWVMASSM